MFNTLCLSKDTKDFFNWLNLSGKNRSIQVSMAIGKALARELPLPSAEIDNLEQYFRNTGAIQFNDLLNYLNEMSVVDVETVNMYAMNFFKIRYYMAYPKPSVVCLSPETAFINFMGISEGLDQTSIEAMREEPVLLMKTYNGVVRFFEEMKKGTN
jgi:hypothetical protein